MDDTGTSILCQVALKEAGETARTMGLNLTAPEHQAVFEELYSFYTESLFQTVNAKLHGGAVSNVVQAFPGSQVVQQQPQAVGQGYQQYQAPPQQQGFGAPQQDYPEPRVKGQYNGTFPGWATKAISEAGVTEVYDNRHMLPSKPRLPWFKATSGGDNPPAFWPPDR